MNASIKPKVSILIPAYNAEKFLDECLDSICRQSYSNLQIVVIDDGSKDDTFSIAKRYAAEDVRIECYSRENRGVAMTRNELLDKVVGDYILFVDSDDWIDEIMVSSLVDIAISYRSDIVMCSFATTCPKASKDNFEIKLWESAEIIEKFLIHRELTGSLCNKLISKNLFDRIRFDNVIAYGEDAMVMWDIIRRCRLMAITSKCLYHYRMNQDSISHQGLTYVKMSALSVWDYICNSISMSESHLRNLAMARKGAEITLLLLSGASNTEIEKSDICILQKELKRALPFMQKSKTLSKRFMLFAVSAAYSWAATKFLVSTLNH